MEVGKRTVSYVTDLSLDRNGFQGCTAREIIIAFESGQVDNDEDRLQLPTVPEGIIDDTHATLEEDGFKIVESTERTVEVPHILLEDEILDHTKGSEGIADAIDS